MPFARCYYHLIWTTKHREPSITDSVAAHLYPTIRHKAIELRSEVLAINGMLDHIHVAATIHTSVSVADWMKHIKGASSYAVNSLLPNLPARFAWQNGYGVLTYGIKQVPFVVAYIENQQQNHAENSLYAYLETIDEE
ncbi:MAG: IS200/IS605 family transposase [Anaerolineae bacterium]|nr:IS200/IS605 family transposase [Anaerolineae bacterium]